MPHKRGRRGPRDERASVAVEVEADPSSVREARDAVTEMLTRNGCDVALTDSSRLVVSELMTNAVVHAKTHIGMRCTLDASHHHVRIEVTDMRPDEPPVMREPEAGEEVGGWGLQFVSALGSNWGVATSEHHKTVWCDVDTPRCSGGTQLNVSS
jgi:anti-sigma regulatory factor (Ser/Thr protein kinase)